MSNSRIAWTGLEEFKAQLRNLPEDLALQAGDIVAHTAQETGAQVQSHYPTGPTGNLKKRVRVEVQHQSKFGVRALLRSQAPHAGIFEKGTVSRKTRKGWNRGRMPKAPEDQAMIPRVVRARRKMTEALKGIVRAAGFEVSE